MALGDGDTWDETNPTNATLATQIDEYDRDIRKGVRSRMAFEHEWPASQSATNEAGKHKFITLQNQATKPTISGTQVAAVYSKTVGSGLQELFFEDEAGNEVQITSGTSLIPGAGTIIQVVNTGTSGLLTLTTSTPFDGTPPQITEGGLAFTRAITPGATGNSLEIVGHVNAAESANTGDMLTVALHSDYGFGAGSTSDAIAVFYRPVSDAGQTSPQTVPIYHYIAVCTTTGAITFTLRVGNNSGSVLINGLAGSTYPGSSMLTVREIKR